MHKPRSQLRERGVSQMSTLYYNTYLVKVAMKGGGVKNFQKVATWFVHDPIALVRVKYNAKKKSQIHFGAQKLALK